MDDIAARLLHTMGVDAGQITLHWVRTALAEAAAAAVPEGFELIEKGELDRLRAVDAKYGWRDRPAPEPRLHAFTPHRKHPWFCGICGYGPSEPLQHILPTPPEKPHDADGLETD